MYVDADEKPEPLYCLKEAARQFNIPYWQLQRAVKKRLVESYTPFNSRPLVRLSEIEAYVLRTRRGGAQ